MSYDFSSQEGVDLFLKENPDMIIVVLKDADEYKYSPVLTGFIMSCAKKIAQKNKFVHKQEVTFPQECFNFHDTNKTGNIFGFVSYKNFIKNSDSAETTSDGRKFDLKELSKIRSKIEELYEKHPGKVVYAMKQMNTDILLYDKMSQMFETAQEKNNAYKAISFYESLVKKDTTGKGYKRFIEIASTHYNLKYDDLSSLLGTKKGSYNFLSKYNK